MQNKRPSKVSARACVRADLLTYSLTHLITYLLAYSLAYLLTYFARARCLHVRYVLTYLLALLLTYARARCLHVRRRGLRALSCLPVRWPEAHTTYHSGEGV